MVTKKEIALGLAKSIKEGIKKHLDIINKNNAKEQIGLAKLNKTVGAVNPAETGAGSDVSGGSGMSSTSTWKAEKDMKKMGVLPGSDGGGTFDGSSMSSPDNTDGLKASEKVPNINKGEINNSTCAKCGGNLKVIGMLSNMIHSLCPSCGIPKMSPQQSNVMKGELEKVTPPDISEKTMYKLKDEYGHSGKGLERAFATAWKIHNSKVSKGEIKASGGSGGEVVKGVTMCKDETSPDDKPNRREAEMVGAVEAKSNPGATLPPKHPKEIKGGDEVKLGKGAIEDLINKERAKYGVKGDVKGLPHPIAPSEKVMPPHNPNFNKGDLMAAPVTKSPSSGVAGKVAAPKMSSKLPKTSAL